MSLMTGLTRSFVVSTLIVASAVAAAPMPTAAEHSGRMSASVGARPIAQRTERSSPTAGSRFYCQDPHPDYFLCYTPAQIQAGYRIAPLLQAGINGKGRTIVIVDAFSDPYVQQDLAIFDRQFGLPDPVLDIVAPDGLTPLDISDPDQQTWSLEIALDVQWAHAIAPKAKIVLVLAKSDEDVDIASAIKYAVDHNLGDVISQSFGEAESCADPQSVAVMHTAYQRAASKGITMIASSGDWGTTVFNCDGTDFMKGVNFPASDPQVLGIGGTSLALDPTTGAYLGETAWTDDAAGCPVGYGCSGGGYSSLFKRPRYQDNAVNRAWRGVPDVAYDAGINGGVLGHWGSGNELYGLAADDPDAFFILGGTSAGSPQWAGLIALADQLGGHRVGQVNDTVYRAASSKAIYTKVFHDVTEGNNNFDRFHGYSANNGWDPVTGLGSPVASLVVPLLAVSGDGR